MAAEAGARAAAFADDFAAANREAVAFTRGCGDASWVLPVSGEGWSVGVVLHHVAEVHAQCVRWLAGMSLGTGVGDTAQDVDRANALHAARAQGVRRDETASLLEANGERLEAVLRALTDDELDRTAPFGPAGGRELPTADLAAVAARHTREHLAHASQAVAEAR